MRTPAGAHDHKGHVDRMSWFVDPFARQCVEDIGDGRNPAFEGDRFAGKTAWVPAAVIFFVMSQGDRVRDLEQLGLRPHEDTVTDHSVSFHDVELVRRKRAGLQKYSIGNSDLTYVVRDAGEPDQLTARRTVPCSFG